MGKLMDKPYERHTEYYLVRARLDIGSRADIHTRRFDSIREASAFAREKEKMGYDVTLTVRIITEVELVDWGI